jgi:hypothetical protein
MGNCQSSPYIYPPLPVQVCCPLVSVEDVVYSRQKRQRLIIQQTDVVIKLALRKLTIICSGLTTKYDVAHSGIA